MVDIWGCINIGGIYVIGEVVGIYGVMCSGGFVLNVG